MRTLLTLLSILAFAAQPLCAAPIAGTALNYQVDSAKSWFRVITPADTSWEFILGTKDLAYFGAVAERIYVSKEDMMSIVRTNFESKLLNPVWTKSTWETIDKRNWVSISVEGTGDGHQLTYHVWIYSGPEGSYQLVGWAQTADFPSFLPNITSMAHSFKFGENPALPFSTLTPTNVPTSTNPIPSAPDSASQ
jgi:hypothetical protein